MKTRIGLSFVCMAGLLGADTLALKNGSTINGRFVSGDDHSVRFAVGNQVNTYDIVDIDSLRFTAPQTASSYSQAAPPQGPPSEAPPGGFTPAPPPQQQAPPPQQQAPPPAYSSSNPPYAAPSGPPPNSNEAYNPPPAPGPAANNIEIPAGTQIAVRLIDAADSQQDSLGKTYRASVEQPVVVNGQTVIPRGSDAVAVLSDAQQSGKIQGKTFLTLALRSVSVNGKTYDLATSNVTKASSSRSTKSGEMIGGGAALGAIIGGIAGGGKGAAIGALSGGALGTAAQVATSGEKVKVPSETVLNFTLQNPLDISQY